MNLSSMTWIMLLHKSMRRASKSEHMRLVQYRARKQAADSSVSRLLTRAVLYRCPNVACFDLAPTQDCMQMAHRFPERPHRIFLVLSDIGIESSSRQVMKQPSCNDLLRHDSGHV